MIYYGTPSVIWDNHNGRIDEGGRRGCSRVLSTRMTHALCNAGWGYCGGGGWDCSLGSFDFNANPYRMLRNASTPAIHDTHIHTHARAHLCRPFFASSEFISNDFDARDRMFAISWSSGEREVTFSKTFDEASSYGCPAITPGFMTMTLQREKRKRRWTKQLLRSCLYTWRRFDSTLSRPTVFDAVFP